MRYPFVVIQVVSDFLLLEDCDDFFNVGNKLDRPQHWASRDAAVDIDTSTAVTSHRPRGTSEYNLSLTDKIGAMSETCRTQQTVAGALWV